MNLRKNRRRAIPPRPDRSPLMWLAVAFGAAVWSSEFMAGFTGFTWMPWYDRPRFFGLFVVAFFYGAHRAWAYHPLYHREYLAWLVRMPWRRAMPLPFGTVLPAWVDLAVIGVLMLMAMLVEPILAPVVILVGAAAAYTLALIPALSATGLHRLVYALAGLLGLGVVVSWSIGAVAAIALAGFVLAVLGAQRSLALMSRGPDWKPQSELSLGAVLLRSIHQPHARKEPGPLGWPYTALAPREQFPRLSRERAILMPLVAAWLVFAFVHIAASRAIEPPPSGIGAVIGVAAAVIRLVIYAAGRSWPISPLARLKLGMLIIPRYDVILIAPLAAAGASLGLWAALDAAGAPLTVTNAVPAAAALWIVLLCPPALGMWDLTGGHRLSPRAS